MKNRVAFFLCCFIIIICFTTCAVIKLKPKAVLSSITVATYLGHQSGVYGGCENWEITVNGKKIILDGLGAGAGLVAGEKYFMVYDSVNFTKYNLGNYSKILTYSPLFIKGEKTATSIGIIEESHFKRKKKNPKILYRISDSLIVETVFRVQINGVWYDHRQDNDVDSNFILPKARDQYEVEYWLENPKRVVLYLDKPIRY